MNTRNLLPAFFLCIAASACVGGTEPTTFVLTNGGDSDIYRNADGALTLTVNGAPASLNEPGCMAECGVLIGSVACAAAAIYPTVERLAPGESATIEWDGVYFEINESRNCYNRRTREADFEVGFCYSHEFTRLDDEYSEDIGSTIPGAYIENPTCEEVPFETGGVVDLVAE